MVQQLYANTQVHMFLVAQVMKRRRRTVADVQTHRARCWFVLRVLQVKFQLRVAMKGS